MTKSITVKNLVGSCLLALAIAPLALRTAEGISVVDRSAAPQKESLYEAGIFFGGGYFPDYPGSNENHARYLPLPYMIYRGSIVRADERDGVRARAILAKRIHMELSVAGLFPGNFQNKAAAHRNAQPEPAREHHARLSHLPPPSR